MTEPTLAHSDTVRGRVWETGSLMDNTIHKYGYRVKSVQCDYHNVVVELLGWGANTKDEVVVAPGNITYGGLLQEVLLAIGFETEEYSSPTPGMLDTCRQRRLEYFRRRYGPHITMDDLSKGED